jgi:hypothetical protein
LLRDAQPLPDLLQGEWRLGQEAQLKDQPQPVRQRGKDRVQRTPLVGGQGFILNLCGNFVAPAAGAG